MLRWCEVGGIHAAEIQGPCGRNTTYIRIRWWIHRTRWNLKTRPISDALYLGVGSSRSFPMSSLTCHIVFPAEPDVLSLLLTSRRVWPLEEASLISVTQPSLPSIPPSKSSISKPRGEVSDVNKGGYSLSKVLGWEKATYLSVQVRLL